MELPILFQDDDVIAVDKPPRCLVVQAPGKRAPTIPDLLRRQIGGSVFPVHRLDEDTTGVLLLARSEPARVAFDEMFRRHAVERVYLAVVSHMPSPAAGRIESRLREDPSGVVESVISGPGKRAVTNYAVLRRIDQHAILVECRPETGRRNQIRVHLAELGCPIVGDRKYGFRGRSAAGRVLLHAHRVRFAHPITGSETIVEAPVPAGFPEP